MHTLRLVCLAAIFCLASVAALAQQSTSTDTLAPPSQRDPQAVAVVQAAIAGFGGSAVAQSFKVQAQVQSPDPGGNNTTSALTWEMAGSEFRVAFSDSSGSSVIVTGHGNPMATTGGVSQAVPKHVVQAMFIPAFAGAILAREFQNQNYSLQYLGAETVNGTPVTAVRTVLPTTPANVTLTDQIWYFSNATNLPIRVVYRSPADQTPLVSIPETVDLSNFTSVSGGLYPFNIIVSRQDAQVAAITLQSVNPNANIPSIDFDPPAGGAQ
jgi:hypothetical protein